MALAATVVTSAVGAATAERAPSHSAGQQCPALAVFGVQGTGESSPDADPKNDTGMLGLMFRPMMADASGLIDRTYVPYEASFGGAVAGGPVPYEQSVDHAVSRLDQMVAEEAKRCPSAKLAGAGYSQGAHAMSMWAKKVGAGQGTVPADRVAGVVLLADPTRQPRSGVFPGRPGQHSPEPVPGTTGSEVSKITVTDPGLDGAGIAPLADTGEGYGSLSGRVADICAPGDLACDAPEHAPVAHLVANIAGQSTLDPNDPVAAISTVAQALATTTFKTVVPVINNDVQGKTLDQLSYEPQKTISQRLAEASDPRSPMPGVDETLSALMKVGTIAFNAVKTVVTKVFTPDTIAQLATVGLADPVGAAMTLGGKVASAVMELVPPATQSRWVNEAFTTLTDNITDNRDLFNISTLITYSDTIAKHQGYASFSSSPSGQSALDVGARWFAAAAHDIASGHGN
ncbi:cutinase family protein [Nocardia terpenica]|uniref:cutinase family protein n=1 Tax=Nocardia terpenica TaxID=455432 RepID=UPI0018932F44|nr:cutinase family protein [Nocardia terpenica]MBF6064683.1 cutinase family protein [Nocardia terpenica]MBF6107199.1 cutinase family protein [Nocardia terpenica]MBF6114957.1 cutinase family protein [Nocardia terpenica]MBF6122062.1 cutinase family protein [Nocardia terpenica]MBF6154445.1 cutinase family protein [Nocardia terpenica]